MKLLSYYKILLPILIIGLCFSSCSKDDEDTTSTVTPVEEVDQELVDDIIDRNDIGVFANSSSCDCYGPFEDFDWDNLTDEEIQTQVETAVASLTEEELQALFTPVCADGIIYANACFADCEGITDFDECDTEWGEDWDDTDVEWGFDFSSLDFLGCYKLQFPATVVFENGSTVEVNSTEQFFETILNAGDESPELAYPITLTHFTNGDVVTITNDEELAALSVDCFDGPNGSGGPGWNGPDFDCVVNNFPITLVIDGVDVTVNSEEDFETIIEDFILTDPSALVNIEVGFPMTLTFDSGIVVVVNNQEEYFDALVENCQ